MNRVQARILLLLAVQLVVGSAASATEESLTTANLLAQAADPAVAAASAEPAAQAAPAATTATDAAAAPAAAAFPPDHLEQLVAPIALYPDSLLMQILMASTYPLEVVEADRYMTKNPELKGDALDKALLEQEWDPSVKSLCTLPNVLKQMSEQLDWTQDLGDAFLAQQADLLDAVQRMRGKAYEAGNLKTSEQQVVTQTEEKIIVIESPDPEVVYVPQYSSTVVYGSAWAYPSYYYPPAYYAPPGYGLMAFGFGMAVGGAIWGDCNWGWGGSDVDIDIDRYNEFNRNTNINADRDRVSQRQGGREGKGSWQHDSSHRKGVNYRDSGTAQKFGAGSGSNRVTKDQARGRSGATASNRAGTGASQRPAASQRPSTGQRPSASSSQRSSAASRPSSASSRPSSAGSSRSGSNSAFSGSRSSSADRMSSSRGASSRGATSYGGSRGGGGARGGGGRRR